MLNKMKMARFGLRALAAAPSAVLVVPGVSARQAVRAFVRLPLRPVVAFFRGAGSEGPARMLADKRCKVRTQSVVGETVPGADAGAGVAVASSAITRVMSDGHTFPVAAPALLAISPVIESKLPFEAKEFVPVDKLIDTPLVPRVPATSPLKTLHCLFKAAKRQPGAVNNGHGGLVKEKASVDLTPIPDRGHARTHTALIANEIQPSFDSAPPSAAKVKGARVRGRAVASRKHLARLSKLATVAQSHPGFGTCTADGLILRDGTPAPVVAQINRDVNREPQYSHDCAKRKNGPAASKPTRPITTRLPDQRAGAVVNWSRYGCPSWTELIQHTHDDATRGEQHRRS